MEEPKPNYPNAMAIIEPVNENQSVKLNVESLEHILLNPAIVNKKVYVISMVGASRSGKSFLFNFLLSYMQYSGSSEIDKWVNSGTTLHGFNWKGTATHDKDGIFLWSQPFIGQDQSGEEVAILLMDTHGAFDSATTAKQCATMFALSSMISSIQLYNLHQNIKENDLLQLQLFAQYGRLALKNYGKVNMPFQNLMVLVRDWQSSADVGYGLIGGQRILDKILKINDDQQPEQQQIREEIIFSFEDIQCFLMPHPGHNAATSTDFKGEINDIDEEFQEQLRIFVSHILDSNNIVVKHINGQPLTYRELVLLIKDYIAILNNVDLFKTESLITAISEARNSTTSNLPINMSSSTSWITKFCGMRRNEFYCQVDEDYIRDASNLTGMANRMPYFDEALDIILNSDGKCKEGQSSNMMEKAAKILYGLIHARYIQTKRGIGQMIEKWERRLFGACARIYCDNQPMLPIGLSDVVGESIVCVYCPRCEDVYSSRSSKHRHADGAFFGTVFPYLLFFVHPELRPKLQTTRYVPSSEAYRVLNYAISSSIEDTTDGKPMKKEPGKDLAKEMAREFNRIERLNHVKRETSGQKAFGWKYSAPDENTNPLADARKILEDAELSNKSNNNI